MITVITPVFNGAPYVRETINSVLSAIGQESIEYIVINDGSTDNTAEILNSYGNQIKVVTQENGGESSAVNRGLEIARGEIALIVSADDPLPSNRVFIGAEDYFKKNPKVVAWYPDWEIIDSTGQVLQKVEVEEFTDTALIGRFKCLPGPGTLIRTASAVSIGGRNTKWTFVGDYDFWLRLSRIGELRKRHECVAQWRFHPQSTSIARRGRRMADERINVIEEFLNSNDVEKSLAREARAHASYYAARLAFFSNKVDGKKLLLRALRSNSMRIQEGNPLVYLFILLLPFSRIIVRFLKPILRKYGKALT